MRGETGSAGRPAVTMAHALRATERRGSKASVKGLLASHLRR